MKFGLLLGLVFLFFEAKGEVPDALQDLQTEFYLPYSETEDVDFTITRPGGYGCYQWSTEAMDIVKLDAVILDYEQMCGTRLDFQIIPKSAKADGKTTITIVAENVDLKEYNADIPAVVEYTIHIAPVARLDVMGLKTELQVGEDPSPFGVSGYDAEDNEFDTLDGLQIAWYIGSKRPIASFESHRQLGPIVKVVPEGAGKGAVIAVITDSNYEGLDAAMLEISVAAPLVVDPDGAFLLEGATAKMRLFEQGGSGKVLKEVNVTEENPEFTLEIKEPDIVSFDKEHSLATGLKEGEETTLFVKDGEGEIIRGVPIRVTSAHSIKVTATPNPWSKQLILGNTYEINVQIFNKDGRAIHPSENILCKTTFPNQLEVLEVSESGLRAKVRATSLGIGKVKASLRSVLTPDDEELEVVPHVKGSTDFEIYEAVVITPKETILPWDKVTKPEYTIKFKANGGGKVYTYSVDNEDLASVDTEGKVTVHGGPGTFKVKAAMARNDDNFDEAVVHILPPMDMKLVAMQHEAITHSPLRILLKFETVLPEAEDPVMYSDCSDLPYEVTLGDNENFVVDHKSKRGETQSFESCATVFIKAKTPGASTKVTVTYTLPSSNKVFKESTMISTFEQMKVVLPRETNNDLVLAVGSSNKVVFQGGPFPWVGKPSSHFKQIEVEDPDVIRVKRVPTPEDGGVYKPLHVYEVTCLAEGETTFSLSVGNQASSTNRRPVSSERAVTVFCSVPNTIDILAKIPNHVGSNIFPIGNPATGRIMAYHYRDLLLALTVKDNKGRTFDSVNSLRFEVKVSDEKLLKRAPGSKVKIPEAPTFYGVEMHGRPYEIFHGQGVKGDVDITIKVAGYDKEVLKAAKIDYLPPLPKVVEDEDEFEEEDEDEDGAPHHHLAETLEITLAGDAEISMVKRKLSNP